MKVMDRNALRKVIIEEANGSGAGAAPTAPTPKKSLLRNVRTRQPDAFAAATVLTAQRRPGRCAAAKFILLRYAPDRLR